MLYDVLSQDERCDYGYHRLVAAIVRQACIDIHAKSPYDRLSSESFFKSDLFVLMMPNYDGPSFIEQVKRNYKERGKYFCNVDADETDCNHDIYMLTRCYDN
jgi:hypothetical protein